jgi:hypothetical protein
MGNPIPLGILSDTDTTVLVTANALRLPRFRADIVQ